MYSKSRGTSHNYITYNHCTEAVPARQITKKVQDEKDIKIIIINSDISFISSKRLYVVELNNFNGKIPRQQTDKMFSVVCNSLESKLNTLIPFISTFLFDFFHKFRVMYVPYYFD